MLLKGKVASVTGGARGLGKVDALALAEAGEALISSQRSFFLKTLHAY